MYLMVGLGNPGIRYRNTWHNLGAMTIAEVARRWNLSLRPGKGEYFSAERTWGEERVMLMIPTSFMNRSGAPVAAVMRYFHIPPEQVVVIYDDHDLPLGKIRIRQEGSSGGHRGMEDIIRMTGTSSISRLKIGIQTGREQPDLADQVLSPIPKSLTASVERIVNVAADGVEIILGDGILAAMERVNGLNL